MLIGHILRVAILFVSGYNMALPEYKWAQPYMIVHGVFIDNALVVVCIAWMLATREGRRMHSSLSARLIACLLCGLGFVGLLSTAINAERVSDYGQALRHCYYAAWLTLAVHWSSKLGPLSVLRPFILGAVFGGSINLYYSISDPWRTLLDIPTLRSQNGAGGFLAIVMGLAAWLVAVREKRTDTWLGLSALVVCTLAVAISYSKTAIVICCIGLAAWIALYFRTLFSVRSAWIALASLILLAGAGLGIRDRFAGTADAIQRLIEIKFTNLDVRDKYYLGSRFQYLFGVVEIMREHPVFGVSYSGFYSAVTQTEPYRRGVMADEDPEVRESGLANPHNTFLLYASANGVPGLALCVVIFLLIAFDVILRHPQDSTLRFVLVCLIGGYFVYGMTLPTLLDTPVMFIAAAIACGRPGRLSQLARSSRFRSVHPRG